VEGIFNFIKTSIYFVHIVHPESMFIVDYAKARLVVSVHSPLYKFVGMVGGVIPRRKILGGGPKSETNGESLIQIAVRGNNRM